MSSFTSYQRDYVKTTPLATRNDGETSSPLAAAARTDDLEAVSTLSRVMGGIFAIFLLFATCSSSLPTSTFRFSIAESAVVPLLLSSNNKAPPKPTDQLQTFLQWWQTGRCEQIQTHLVTPQFEYRVTMFGVDDGDDAVPLVYTAQAFVQELCKPFAGHFVVHWEDDHHSNLGKSFGTLRAFGSDYYDIKGQDAKCLAPYYATFAVTLDSTTGRIEVLRELVHNVETYNQFTKECLQRIGGGDSKRRLLSHKKDTKKKKSHKKKEPMSMMEVAQTVFNLYGMGKCEEMRPYLAPDFAVTESAQHVTPPIGLDGFVALCQKAIATTPTVFHSITSLSDGNTLTLAGPSLSMVGNCPIFGKKSFFVNFTVSEPQLLTHMTVTTSDSFWEDLAACRKKQ